MTSSFEKALVMESEKEDQNVNLDFENFTGWHSPLPKFKRNTPIIRKSFKIVTSNNNRPRTNRQKTTNNRARTTYHASSTPGHLKESTLLTIHSPTMQGKRSVASKDPYVPKYLRCTCFYKKGNSGSSCDSAECVMKALTARRNLFWGVSRKGKLRRLQEKDFPKSMSPGLSRSLNESSLGNSDVFSKNPKKKLLENPQKVGFRVVTSFVSNHKPRKKKNTNKFLQQIEGTNLFQRINM